MADATVLASVIDPQGRTVTLTSERWAHIVDGHPELAQHQADRRRLP